jgi:hypothetical protein
MLTPCCFIPPDVLGTVARVGRPDVAERARYTLRRDAGWRVTVPARRATTGEEPSVGTPEMPHRLLFDAQGTEILPGRKVRFTGRRAAIDPAAVEANRALGEVWRFFSTAFGADARRNLPLQATVRYGRLYSNAAWDGEGLVLGTGDGEVFGDFASSLTVIGHGVTHGLIARTAGLGYEGEPGALRESVADAFAAMVTQFDAGTPAAEADWLLGSDVILPGVPGTGLRHLLHPGTAFADPRIGVDPQPATMAGFVHTSADHGGVHINSSIPNRAFALAAGSVDGHAWQTVGQVWFDVVTGPHITPDCDFASFARLTGEAASRRFGRRDPIADAVRDAWATVGVTRTRLAPGEPRRDGADEADPSGAGTGAPGGRTPGRAVRAPQRARSTPGRPVLPGHSAELTLRRYCGVSGPVRQRTVQLADLPVSDAVSWSDLLASPELEAMADVDPIPDTFTYEVVCTGFDVAVTVPEVRLDRAQRDLFRRTMQS